MLDYVAYVLGIGFLIACVLGVRVLRNLVHDRMLKSLRLEGTTVLPRFPGLSGLRVVRPSWTGEVAFEAARLGGGRVGHLRLRAQFPFPPRPAGEEAAIRSGDESFDRVIAVEGDPAFAKKFLVPEMRDRLMELDRARGQISHLGEGTIEIDGPLPVDAAALERFLELCDGIVQGAAAAAGA